MVRVSCPVTTCPRTGRPTACRTTRTLPASWPSPSGPLAGRLARRPSRSPEASPGLGGLDVLPVSPSRGWEDCRALRVLTLEHGGGPTGGPASPRSDPDVVEGGRWTGPSRCGVEPQWRDSTGPEVLVPFDLGAPASEFEELLQPLSVCLLNQQDTPASSRHSSVPGVPTAPRVRRGSAPEAWNLLCSSTYCFTNDPSPAFSCMSIAGQSGSLTHDENPSTYINRRL